MTSPHTISPNLRLATIVSLVAHLGLLWLPGPPVAMAPGSEASPFLVVQAPAPFKDPEPVMNRERRGDVPIRRDATRALEPAATPTPAPRVDLPVAQPTPPPPKPAPPAWTRFVRTDDLQEVASSDAQVVSDRNTRASEQTRAEVIARRSGATAPPSATQTGTSTSPGLVRPLRWARDTRGEDFDAKRATTAAEAGASASGPGEEADRRPDRSTLATAEPQPAGAVQSRSAPASVQQAAPEKTASTMPQHPSSPQPDRTRTGADGGPVAVPDEVHQQRAAAADIGAPASSVDAAPQVVSISDRDPWWRPSVARVTPHASSEAIATLSRSSEASPDTPSEGQPLRRAPSPRRDRQAAVEQERPVVAPLSAPPPRQAQLDHEPIPDLAETPPSPSEEIDEAAPAMARTRPLPHAGNADAVQELRDALGWGRTEETKRRPRKADPGMQGAPSSSSASTQTVFDDARLSAEVGVNASATPLGIWLAKVDDRIRSAFFEQDLPADDRALGIQGVATVVFRIDASGRTSELRLKTSSGHPTLDAIALASIPSKLPRMPRNLDRRSLQHRVALRYRASDMTVGVR